MLGPTVEQSPTLALPRALKHLLCARAGMLSGKLLQDFCPDTSPCDARTQGAPDGGTGTCNGRALWGIIGCITLTSPLLMLVLQARLGSKPNPTLH